MEGGDPAHRRCAVNFNVRRKLTRVLIFALLPALAPGASRAADSEPAAVAACAAEIANCGCTITKPGTYAVSADLSASSGLTAGNGCIDVKAARVKLLLQGHLIQGAGTGVGLHLLPSATGAFVEGQGAEGDEPGTSALIEDWDTGIRWEASNGILDHLGSQSNASFGIELDNARGNDISDYDASFNGIYGTFIVGSSANQIDAAKSGDNAIAGIYLGCSTGGPSGERCKGVKPSNNNFIYDVHAGVSKGSQVVSKFGIVIDTGNGGNLVTDDLSRGDTTDDLTDMNPGCGTNIWFANSFDTQSSTPPCIQ